MYNVYNKSVCLFRGNTRRRGQPSIEDRLNRIEKDMALGAELFNHYGTELMYLKGRVQALENKQQAFRDEFNLWKYDTVSLMTKYDQARQSLKCLRWLVFDENKKRRSTNKRVAELEKLVEKYEKILRVMKKI